MLGKIRNFLGTLRADKDGNAMLLMAMGMPVLIGTSGMAVDFSQWYMWKRELQYAVDQAAIAGAWAKADALSASSYNSRASQEFTANLSLLTGKTSNPSIGLENYGSGTNNSVAVSATTTQTLPFSKILINRGVTVAARAQATFEAATNYTVCMLAVDETATNGVIVGGSMSGNVTCGAGTLAVSTESIRKNGSSNGQFGYFVAAGGIDSGLAANGTLNANVSNLDDPYAGLTPPSDSTARTYSCPASSGTTTTDPSSTKTATVSTTVTTTYTYWQGKNQNQANKAIEYTGTGSKTGGSSTTVANNQSVASGITEGQESSTTDFNGWTGDHWTATTAKNEEIYEKKTVVSTVKYTNVVTAAGSGGSSGGGTATSGVYTLLPGTYSAIDISCDTHFSPGVYTINGTLDLGTNHEVTGSDVMLVLKGVGSEKLKINNGSIIKLSGITKDTLMNTYGMSDEEASSLATMVVYDTTSTADVKFNGHATIGLEGIVYMPQRNGKFNGNSTMSGKCMILALATLEFTGNNSLSSFCLPSGATGINLGGTTVKVRLVA